MFPANIFPLAILSKSLQVKDFGGIQINYRYFLFGQSSFWKSVEIGWKVRYLDDKNICW